MSEEWTLFDLETGGHQKLVDTPHPRKSVHPENSLRDSETVKTPLPGNIDKLTKLFIHPVREGRGETGGLSTSPPVSTGGHEPARGRGADIKHIWTVVCLECGNRKTFGRREAAEAWCIKHRRDTRNNPPAWAAPRRPGPGHYVSEPFVTYVRVSTTGHTLDGCNR